MVLLIWPIRDSRNLKRRHSITILYSLKSPHRFRPSAISCPYRPPARRPAMELAISALSIQVPEIVKSDQKKPNNQAHPPSKIRPPFLLRGKLRPYQQSGLDWLANLHNINLNGILADEMVNSLLSFIWFIHPVLISLGFGELAPASTHSRE
jgi:hypothetical protein